MLNLNSAIRSPFRKFQLEVLSIMFLQNLIKKVNLPERQEPFANLLRKLQNKVALG